MLNRDRAGGGRTDEGRDDDDDGAADDDDGAADNDELEEEAAWDVCAGDV